MAADEIHSPLGQRIRCTPYLRRGINHFLADLYDQPRLLSDILAGGGFSPAEIATLHDRLPVFLPQLVQAWVAEWRLTLPVSEITALLRAYGLDGRPPATQDVWQTVARRALGKLRLHLRRARLERVVLVVAQEVLAAR